MASSGKVFRARIPYDRPDERTGTRIIRGVHQVRRRRDGRVFVGVVDKTRDTLGRVLSVVERSDGLDVVYEACVSRAQHIVEVAGQGYFLDPIIGGRTIVAFEIHALRTWDEAELRPSSHVPSVPTIGSRPVPSPLPPAPKVNLDPSGTWIWQLMDVPRRPKVGT